MTATNRAVISASQIPQMLLLVLSIKMGTVLGEILNKMSIVPSIYLVVLLLEISGYINMLMHNTELGYEHSYKQNFH